MNQEHVGCLPGVGSNAAQTKKTCLLADRVLAPKSCAIIEKQGQFLIGYEKKKYSVLKREIVLSLFKKSARKLIQKSKFIFKYIEMYFLKDIWSLFKD